jgi:hypothetical protein
MHPKKQLALLLETLAWVQEHLAVLRDLQILLLERLSFLQVHLVGGELIHLDIHWAVLPSCLCF